MTFVSGIEKSEGWVDFVLMAGSVKKFGLVQMVWLIKWPMILSLVGLVD